MPDNTNIPDDSAAVQCAVEGPVAILTINRPQARNAVNEAVAAGMAAALDDAEARKDIQVIVVTGAGGTFCAGMDLKGFLRGENPRAGGRGFAGHRGAAAGQAGDRRGGGLRAGRRLRDRAEL